MKAISGLSFITLRGISASRCSGSLDSGATPSRTWICLEQMMMPMAASIPCTTDEGKKSPRAPARRSAKTICTAAATTMVASARR